MQFYKYEGSMVNTDRSKDRDSRRASAAGDRKILLKTKAFNKRLEGKAFLFAVSTSEDTFNAGAILRESDDLTKLIAEYLRTIEVKLEDTCLEEVTFGKLKSMLDMAERNDFIEDSDEVLRQFDLAALVRRRGCFFEENTLNNCIRKSVYEEAAGYLAKDTLIPELDRIYAGCAGSSADGHPVHYMILTDDRDTRKGMYRLLLQALYSNNRLRSKRYSFLNPGPHDGSSGCEYEQLYKSSTGGTVVVRYSADDNTEDDCEDQGRDTIEMLCGIMKKYRNQVLTVFCLPRECTGLRDIFYENLGNVSIVELREDVLSGARAEDYLRMIAKNRGIRTDRKLFAKLDGNKDYLAPDLRAVFEEWYDSKLKNDIYPQYRDIGTGERETVKAASETENCGEQMTGSAASASRGTAYEELDRMIGLEEAKKVIDQALNYHMAQKLYADKGMKNDLPGSHMVFTGNPGTAKTTVARLFAKIMKENDLLSKGQLIEAGRADLVGRYVGWTAPLIKKKFKQARGGVLFIDEAYSLVDDRDGSYGDEAITAIVQEMENHRDDVLVIFAGYPDKMEEFLRKNPGLRSRIAFHIHFDDYDTESLCRIARLIAERKDLILTEEACEKLTGIFKTAREENDFGNGRYVRNIIEKAEMARAGRLIMMDQDSLSSEDIKTICAEDIEQPVIRPKTEQKHIGFSA